MKIHKATILLMLIFWSASQAGNLIASNANVALLHNIDDYLAFVPTERLDIAARVELKSKAVVEAKDVQENGDYHLHYRFLVPGVAVMSELTVVSTRNSAEKVFSDMIAGTKAGIADSGASLREIKCSLQWSQECYLFIADSADTPSVGNLIFLKQERNLYSLQIFGLGAFETVEDAAIFLERKAKPLLNFTPMIAPANSNASGLGVISLVLLVVNTVVYLLLYGAASFVNKVIGRKSLNRQWTGTLGVIAFTSFLCWFMWTHIMDAGLYARMSPFEQGRYGGRIFLSAILPGLLVLFLFGMRSWRDSKKSAQVGVQPPTNNS